MEILIHPSKFNTQLLSLFIVVLCFAIIVPKPVFAKKKCDIPAIFNFGDSNSDTGGLAATLKAPQSPYGETYFHRPSGRFTDGRFIIDFIAQSFGLPYVDAYLDSLGTNFTHGANFATAGSTIRPVNSSIIPNGRFSPFYFEVQYTQFRDFIPTTQFLRHQGGTFATLVPKKEYFSKALYTFDIGQNDVVADIRDNKTVQQVKASIPDLLKSFSTTIKKIHDLGARSFWIHNLAPLGCLPSLLTDFPSAERDKYGCAKPFNEVAQYFNKILKETVFQLRKDLPLAAITYVDTYSVKYSLFSHPKKYGFELPFVTCCGIGGKYNFNGSVQCGATIEVNGTKTIVGSCKVLNCGCGRGFGYAADFAIKDISGAALRIADVVV